MGTTRHGEVCGHEPGKFLPLLPCEQAFERRLEIDATNLREACEAADKWPQPRVEVVCERVV